MICRLRTADIAVRCQGGDGEAKRTTIGVEVSSEVIAAPLTERGWASAAGLEGNAGSAHTDAERGVEAVTVTRHVAAVSIADGEGGEAAEIAERTGEAALEGGQGGAEGGVELGSCRSGRGGAWRTANAGRWARRRREGRRGGGGGGGSGGLGRRGGDEAAAAAGLGAGEATAAAGETPPENLPRLT